MVVSLLIIAFNLEIKVFYCLNYVFQRIAYENQVYITQVVIKSVIITLSIFQHGEQMMVFKTRFFMMIFQDFKELWRWITSFVILKPKFLYDY